jgi:hypothetical protein
MFSGVAEAECDNNSIATHATHIYHILSTSIDGDARKKNDRAGLSSELLFWWSSADGFDSHGKIEFYQTGIILKLIHLQGVPPWDRFIQPCLYPNGTVVMHNGCITSLNSEAMVVASLKNRAIRPRILSAIARVEMFFDGEGEKVL